MRRALVIVLILAAVISASVWGYANLTAKEAEAPEGIVTETVERGEIMAIVSAIGSIEAQERRTLAFGTAGEVREVLTDEGDEVGADQILARLDTRDLEIAVAQARLSVQTSELQVQKTEKGVEPSEEDIASAQAAIDSARRPLTTC